MRFGQDTRVSVLFYRSLVQWYLGYPDAALVDAGRALDDAREIGQAATLMFLLAMAPLPYIHCGKYTTANALLDETLALADEKGSLLWNAVAMLARGCIFSLTGKASDAVQIMTSGLSTYRSTGATFLTPLHLSHLAKAYADHGQFEEAWRCIGEAMTAVENTKERWHQTEVNRIAGELALMAPAPDPAKAEAYFERALAVARAQQAKSWELPTAMSMARLRRDQGKQREAHDLLAPIYGWFTEGFDTRDLKEAKALLEELGHNGLLDAHE
jgi:predicted ATPase